MEKIKDLKFSDGRYTWEWEDIKYETNSEARGIFRISSRTQERQQLEGTAQFVLSGMTKNSARRKINKYFEKNFPFGWRNN